MFPVIFQFLATTYKTDYIHSTTIENGSHICLVFLLWWSRDKYLLCRYCLPTDQPSELIDGNLSHSVCKLLKTRTKGKTFFHVKILINFVRGCHRGQEMKHIVETFSLFTYIKCSPCNGIVFFSLLAPGNSRSQRYLVPHQSMSLIGREDAPSTQYSICFLSTRLRLLIWLSWSK